MIHQTVGDDRSYYFTCDRSHEKITSPRYDSHEKAQEELDKHKDRMGCK